MQRGLALGDWVAERYRLDTILGEGGFGTVYVATRPVDAVQVALKIFHPRALDHVGGDARFRREAELARRLDHPNVVKVLDAGVDEHSGARFIAFELLRGRSLHDELSRWGAMQPRRAMEIAIEICRALEEAHAIGIVHRDLKPANVFVLDASDRIKVLDFGIAKSTNPGTMVGLTEAGQALGTPAYMATEQLTGAAVGPVTDLFALGIILLEMLLGRLPYPHAASGMEIVRERLMGAPVPIPRDLALSSLGAVLARATALEPATRFQSAAEMRSALERTLESPDVTRSSLGSRHAASDAFEPTAGFAMAADTEVAPRAPPIAAAGAPVVPQPWTAPAPAWPQKPRRSAAGILAVVLGVFALSALGVVFAAFQLFDRDTPDAGREPRRDARPADDEDERDENDDLEIDDRSIPLPRGENRPATSRVVDCRGASSQNEATLQSHLVALGWSIGGVLRYCAGSMINFDCTGGDGRGVTGMRNGLPGSAAVVRFSSPSEAKAFVEEPPSEPNEVTWGVDGSALLRLEMNASDADRVLARICPAH
jgi:eukaryotic-like serine/threonine-protein kinase